MRVAGGNGGLIADRLVRRVERVFLGEGEDVGRGEVELGSHNFSIFFANQVTPISTAGNPPRRVPIPPPVFCAKYS